LKTTEIAIVFIIGSLTLMVFVVFLVLIIVEYRKRQIRHITEKLELEHEYQNQLLKTQIEVQEQSFKHFSEEVHDNIAQVMSLARIKLYKAANAANDDRVTANINTGNELLGKALDDLRRLSHILNGNLVSDLPLAESIEKELAYVLSSGEMEASLTISGEACELPPEKKLLLFRILQEAIGNAIKHGEAKKIAITLNYTGRTLAVTITDNGKGFDTQLTTQSTGLGLRNMQARAKMLGKIDISSAAGKGTTININLEADE